MTPQLGLRWWGSKFFCCLCSRTWYFLCLWTLKDSKMHLQLVLWSFGHSTNTVSLRVAMFIVIFELMSLIVFYICWYIDTLPWTVCVQWCQCQCQLVAVYWHLHFLLISLNVVLCWLLGFTSWPSCFYVWRHHMGTERWCFQLATNC